jgi:hypothetical protein
MPDRSEDDAQRPVLGEYEAEGDAQQDAEEESRCPDQLRGHGTTCGLVAHSDYATPVPYPVAYRWHNLAQHGTVWHSVRPCFVRGSGVAYGARTPQISGRSVLRTPTLAEHVLDVGPLSAEHEVIDPRT